MNKKKMTDVIVMIVLVLYPLRHAACGLDLWDAGYNCVNFLNPGLGSMSAATFFSTYLATWTGHFLTMLPGGDTYLGINIYCGLIISAGCLISYLFMTRQTGAGRLQVFAGELLMLSVCYSPVVILYNHLSNLLVLIAIVCLYTALRKNRDHLFVMAGICIGTNVFVRFSNLPQAALILAVWAYFYWKRKEYEKRAFGTAVRKTLLCLAGYMGAILVILAVLSFVYGRGSYISGIQKLFAMTSDAEYYKSSYMIRDMIIAYLKGMHRLVYIAAFCALAVGVNYIKDRWGNGRRITNIIYGILLLLLSAGIVIVMIYKNFLQFDFHHYAVVYLSAALFLDGAMLYAVWNIISRDTSGDKKLLAILVLLQIILNSVGSNTGIAVAMNSMYLSGPYIACCLFDTVRDKRFGKYSFPISLILSVSAVAFFVQCLLFGVTFVYQEGYNTGVRDSYVTGNRVLKNIAMSEGRAACFQRITDYRNDKGLKGSGAIIYGFVPATAYYLELVPLMQPWPDLESYPLADMKADIERIEDGIDKGSMEYPLVIIGAIEAPGGVSVNPGKADLIEAFLKEHDYAPDYSDDMFEVWRRIK